MLRHNIVSVHLESTPGKLTPVHRALIVLHTIPDEGKHTLTGLCLAEERGRIVLLKDDGSDSIISEAEVIADSEDMSVLHLGVAVVLLTNAAIGAIVGAGAGLATVVMSLRRL